MKRKLFPALLLFSFVISVVALGQDRPAPLQPNTLQVAADGKFEADPDTALINFNISVQADTAKAAYDRAAQETEQLRSLLRSNGIDPKSAEISGYSTQPVIDWKSPKRRVIGYSVGNHVVLKLKELAKVGPLVQSLGEQDYAQSLSLGYTLDNMEAAKNKAVADAYRKAHDEAASLASVAGRSLGELVYASVDVMEPVRPMPMMMAERATSGAVAAPPTAEFNPQKITVSARVNAVFGMK